MKFLDIFAFIFLTRHLLAKITYPESFPASSPLSSNLDFTTFSLLSQDKNLTSFQTQSLFLIMDQNKDGTVDKTEYFSFYELFIEPFEETCDTSGTYLLSSDEIKKCIESLEEFQQLSKLIKEDETTLDKCKKIINAVNNTNFYNYLILRRYSFAWKICGCKKEISRNQLACAWGFVSDISDSSRIEVNTLYALITNYSGSSINKSKTKANFFGFFFATVVYSKFNAIQNNAMRSLISLDMVNNAYEQGLFYFNTTNLTMISKLFNYNADEGDISETIDLKTFFLWNKAFFDLSEDIATSEQLKTFSKQGPIPIYEIYKRCEDKILGDAKKREENKTEIEKAFEMEFLNNFLQIRSETTKKNFDDNQKLDAFEIVQLWKFTVIFNVFDVQQNCLVSNLNFKKNIDYVEEIVVLKPNERHILRQILKADKKFPINLVEFLGIFLYKDIFSKYYKNETNLYSVSWPLISLPSLVSGLNKLSLTLKDTTIAALIYEIEVGWIYRIDFEQAYFRALHEYSESLADKFLNKTFV